jgi:hypothetical protein
VDADTSCYFAKITPTLITTRISHGSATLFLIEKGLLCVLLLELESKQQERGKIVI